jgi:HEAT repeat protein
MEIKPIDLLFLVAGFVAGVVAGVALDLRRRIVALRDSLQRRASDTSAYIARSADERYLRDMIAYCEKQHLIGEKVPLQDVLVEPRFLGEPAFADLSGGDAAENIFRVVPRTFQNPELFAPYNVPSYSVENLGAGDRHLLILGAPGSGKTTALNSVALWALEALEFASFDTIARQAGENGEGDESDENEEDDLAALRRQVMEQLAVSREEDEEKTESGEEEDARSLIDYRSLVPILIELEQLDLRPETVGERVDPAEPVAMLVQQQVGAVTAQGVPHVIYDSLNAGQSLVLIDGYAELPEDLRAEKLVWLRAFMRQYGQNVIIMSAPLQGNANLLQENFTPLYLRPWTDRDYATLIDRWAAAWSHISAGGRSTARPADEEAVERARAAVRGRTPLEATLKVWSTFADDQLEPGIIGWFDFWVRRAMRMNEKYREQLEELAAKVLDGDGYTIRLELAQSWLTDQFSEVGADGEVRVTENVDGILNDYIDRFGILGRLPGDRLMFKHRPMLSFLAAGYLLQPDNWGLVLQRSRQAHWPGAMRFVAASGKGDMADVVREKLGETNNLLHGDTLEVGTWLRDSSRAADWRGDVFKRLSAFFLNPNQYSEIRERALAAMISSYDRSLLFVLRQALGSQVAYVRQLACLGLGVLGDQEAIKDLDEMLRDQHPDVQLAATLALGAIGTERALELIVGELLQGESEVRRAVAETLAAIPGEGHDVLRDAVVLDDMDVRRAAVFGLGRVKTGWALALLYRRMLEDDQWYVRSAAESVFEDARNPAGTGPIHHPPVDSLIWLTQWAAQRGEGVPQGEPAKQMLVRVLQEAEQPQFRAIAAATLGRITYVPALKPLYRALDDQSEGVRDIVFASLAKFQDRLGDPLPSTV